VTPD
jgi:hypothetical protein